MQAARNRKFKIWYNQYTSTDEFEFVSEKLEIGEDEYFTAMIIKKTHEKSIETTNTFHQYFNDLREKLD